MTALAAVGAATQGATFHGRDLLAPLAAELAGGGLGFDELGEICLPLAIPQPQPVTAAGGRLVGEVVTVDRFRYPASAPTAKHHPAHSWRS